MKKAALGFTLIELLVVISIIAILATVGAAIFSGVQSRARDARRQSDIISIAKAMEANKVVGAATYLSIQQDWFASGTVPAEAASSIPKYSMAYVNTNNCKIGRGTMDWGAGVPKPTAASFTMTPASCDTVITVEVVADDIPGVGDFNTVTSFLVCALLENGGTNNAYCQPNQQ